MLLIALAVLAVTALSSSASAWTSQDLVPAEKEYRSAFVYNVGSEYFRDENVFASYTSIPLSGNYRGYISYPVSQFDDRTHIESASITFIGRTSTPIDVRAKVMGREMHEIDPGIAFSSIWSATTVGTVRVTGGLEYRTYSLDITGDALDELRSVMAGDDDYLVIGFHRVGTGSVDVFSRYQDLSGTYYSTLTLEYDDEAPQVPPADLLESYVTGDHIPVSWSSSHDNPSGGNRGDVSYQVGFYLPDALAENPYYVGPWVAATYWNMTGIMDGQSYIFRVRARDGSGFTSNWSSPVNTTVDNSPPTVPQIQPEPAYSPSAENTITWWPSLDAGVGNVSYEYQYSMDPTFPGEVYRFTSGTNFTVDKLIDATYFYRVRAKDDFGHTSVWSSIERSTQDATPPSVPMVMEEPEITMGTVNIFNWHPSFDVGYGGVIYYYQIATSPTFSPETILVEYPTELTTIGTADLEDRQTYYFRVAALDGFGYQSNWSDPVWSTQDASPPSAVNVHRRPKVVAAEPLTITWDPAVDHGIGVSHYEVWWHIQGPPGSSPMVYSIEVIGQSLTWPSLGEGKWIFGIMAVDRFGQIGPNSGFNVTVDDTPPTAPVVEELREYSKDWRTTITWTPSTDEGAGVDFYRLAYRKWNFTDTTLYVDTEDTEVTLLYLEEDIIYWFEVHVFDKVGNSRVSNEVHTYFDYSPPPAVEVDPIPEFLNVTSIEIHWGVAVDEGAGTREYWLFWRHIEEAHVKCDHGAGGDSGWIRDTSYTIDGLEDGATYCIYVASTDWLGHVSEESEWLFTTVDLSAPNITIRSPSDGDVVSGSVQVEFMYDDVNPLWYTVSYMVPADGGPGETIRYIVKEMPLPGNNNFSEVWDTTDVPDGVRTLTISVEDRVGNHVEAEMEVTVINARLQLGPSDITLSDPVPEQGDKVTVHVSVRNTGDSAAHGVLVELFYGGKLVGSHTNVTIDANSVRAFEFEVTTDGTYELTARARSDLHDTGEMDVGRTLTVGEEDNGGSVSVSSPVAWVGMLAIILAIIAIALNLVSRRAQEGPDQEADEENIWVETGDRDDRGG
jgi:hypothetical protein